MARGRRAGGSGMWASHPPIEERIERLRSIGNIGV
jgi:Zn-dependent protease with chaperone function